MWISFVHLPSLQLSHKGSNRSHKHSNMVGLECLAFQMLWTSPRGLSIHDLQQGIIRVIVKGIWRIKSFPISQVTVWSTNALGYVKGGGYASRNIFRKWMHLFSIWSLTVQLISSWAFGSSSKRKSSTEWQTCTISDPCAKCSSLERYGNAFCLFCTTQDYKNTGNSQELSR